MDSIGTNAYTFHPLWHLVSDPCLLVLTNLGLLLQPRDGFGARGCCFALVGDGICVGLVPNATFVPLLVAQYGKVVAVIVNRLAVSWSSYVACGSVHLVMGARL